MSFPETRHSMLRAVRSDDAEARRVALELLVASYWRPVYKYVRLRFGLGREDAEDVTQGFFARALEKSFFDRYQPERSRFRTFLRTCLDGFAANEWKSARRLKRGGGIHTLSLDFNSAEGEIEQREIRDPSDMDDYFRREWVRSLFGLAVEELQQRCHRSGKDAQFALFQRYDIDGADGAERPTYEELAREHGLPATQVTNYLAWARREFRAIVLDRLRELTATDEEFRSEARDVLGITPE